MAARAAFDIELARELIDRRTVDARSGAADPARPPASVRLYRRRRRRAGRGRAQHLQGRGARRRQLLPRLPAQPGRRTGAEDVPGGILPGDGLRGPRRPSREPPRRCRRTSPEPAQRPPCRDRLLPRQLRPFARRAARRRADRPARPRPARRDRGRRKGARPRERARLRSCGFLGALRRRRRRGRGSGARGAPAQHRAFDRAHRLARPFLAGAAGRSRRRRKAASATGPSPRRTPRRCSTPGFWPAAAIRRRSAGSRTSPISPASSASSSPAAA